MPSDAGDRYGDKVRSFNTAGPCDPVRNYMLPPEPRLPDARQLVEDGQYFIVRGPRQTGKTTTLWTLARQLTAERGHAALMFSCECAEPAQDDYGAAELIVLNSIRRAARLSLPMALLPPDPWPGAPPGRRIFEGLQDWAVKCPLPLVLFFDEIDALRGESLRSVLRQLRNGFQFRAQAFPASVVLCGLRDVRDYKALGGTPSRLGTSSPFNIADDALRLDDFTFDEVAALYRQRTEETRQEFTPEAIDRAYEYSQGQPWLANALAWEITFWMGVKPPETITADHVDTAKERLILGRPAHLDSLIARLSEPRVRRIIDPMIAGTRPEGGDDVTYDDDLSYIRDLGLIAPSDPIRIANPIYREVIVRVLGTRTQSIITEAPQRFLLPDGRLDFRALLEAFTDFWIENGEFLTGASAYHESAPHLVFMAFLQRIVNGGGYISREYGVGSGRIDLLVRKPYGDGNVQFEAMELKVWAPGRPDPLNAGLKQLDGYLDRLQLETGTLVIFDRRPDAAPIHERTAITKADSPSGRTVTLLRA